MSRRRKGARLGGSGRKSVAMGPRDPRSLHRNDQTAGQLEKGFGPEFETDKKQRVRLRLGRGLVSTNDKIEIDIEYLRAQLGL